MADMSTAVISTDLCMTGIELRQNALAADRHFKEQIIRFFSTLAGSEEERDLLGELGEQQREADEKFNRHRLMCPVCAQADCHENH